MTPSDLKSWRERHKLSKADAAIALGLSVRGLENQLYGHRPISAQTERLATLDDGVRELVATWHGSADIEPGMGRLKKIIATESSH